MFAMLTMYVTTVYANVNATLLRQAIRKVKLEWEDDMLSIAAREWMAAGEARGRVVGKAKALLYQLGRCCGPVSPEIESRVRMVDSAQLDEWMDHLMDAHILADVFGSPVGPRCS